MRADPARAPSAPRRRPLARTRAVARAEAELSALRDVGEDVVAELLAAAGALRDAAMPDAAVRALIERTPFGRRLERLLDAADELRGVRW